MDVGLAVRDDDELLAADLIGDRWLQAFAVPSHAYPPVFRSCTVRIGKGISMPARAKRSRRLLTNSCLIRNRSTNRPARRMTVHRMAKSPNGGKRTNGGKWATQP